MPWVAQVGGRPECTAQKHKDDFCKGLVDTNWRDDREVSSNNENFTVNIEGFKESDF